MTEIRVLDKSVIDQIAAGEVVERPLSVVKELVENAIDAGATAITVEIKGGGTALIRVTDNGSGIDPEYVRTAFLPHATSKIRAVEDLLSVRSLGFRGEALSSVAAVSRVELITKTEKALSGVRYLIEGGRELSFEEVGAPKGSTFLVRDLFYNIPARRKFLKSERTEGNAIAALMEHLSMSHPEISFCFLSGGKAVLDTSGNRKGKDVIYRIYGSEISKSLLPVEAEDERIRISGFIGKPGVSRGSRSFENYFVNGRYIKSDVLSSGIEDAYHSYLMQHQYPFTALHFEVAGEEIDVNIHPQKMELKFHHAEEIYQSVVTALRKTLLSGELIPENPPDPEVEKPRASVLPEPFEAGRRAEGSEPREYAAETETVEAPEPEAFETADVLPEPSEAEIPGAPESQVPQAPQEPEPRFLTPEAKENYKILGQVFRTYWLVEFSDKLYLVDQHAAHEKVIFERLMKRKEKKEVLIQQLLPGIVLELSPSEEETFSIHKEELMEAGFRFEPFGGRAIEITAVPSDLYGLNERQYFLELLDSLSSDGSKTGSETLYLRIATMSCKAAVKGNDELTTAEFSALLEELLALDNPYQCPHGRPTIVTITKQELEKKFKRIVG